MLTVYTYRRDRPAGSLDLSTIPLAELTPAALDIYHHQKTCTIWFGYLEGWMLNPHEEVLLRKVLRKFDCHLVTHVPFSLSQAWKNEIDTLYTASV